MKIVNTLPPNYEIIIASDLSPSKETTFCFGDTIYNPSGKEISADIEHHEYIHSQQQSDNPDAWWYAYLTDKNFRLSQELEAYGKQYQFAKEHGIKGRLLDWALDNMAKALSGKEYGSMIGYGEARSKIRNYSKLII